MTTLSILTPTIPGREAQLAALQTKITNQSVGKRVEHLSLCDNRFMSIGEKRQRLVNIAAGKYIAFCDDDDDVSDDYVAKLLEAARRDADVITFRQRVTYNGIEGEAVFGISNEDEPFVAGSFNRAPWHVCAWKRERVKDCQFAFKNYGEDIVWATQARAKVRSGFHIDSVLHHYRHDEKLTAAPMPV